ncbi:MerR family transcriptional regulator [Bradyrhizobium diazoefficiens]|nr:MerR family transcriptional regulator [Bradyrhizobium diazoefficiens]MBR0779147.1 MerR family transcriptional regulator [Bradyrhizobium diazoefficiens]
MRIGVLAEAAGVSVPTVRYYESVGLLTPPARQGGQRIYGSDDLKALSLIRRCRELDFSIDEIRAVLASVQARSPCSETKTFAEKHLGSIRARIAELRALEATVAALVNGCETTCCDGAAPDCVILQGGCGTSLSPSS